MGTLLAWLEPGEEQAFGELLSEVERNVEPTESEAYNRDEASMVAKLGDPDTSLAEDELDVLRADVRAYFHYTSEAPDSPRSRAYRKLGKALGVTL